MTEQKYPHLDTRNVKDEYKGMDEEAIKQILRQKNNGFSVAMSHIEGDFNFGSVIRSANSFGAFEVMYIGGKRSWDRRSAVGAHHYTQLSYFAEWGDFFNYAEEQCYLPVALENNVNYPVCDMRSFKWPTHPVIIVGEEQTGLPDECLSWAKKLGWIVSIPDFGSVRSLNVASAATTAMYDLVTKVKT